MIRGIRVFGIVFAIEGSAKKKDADWAAWRTLVGLEGSKPKGNRGLMLGFIFSFPFGKTHPDWTVVL